METKDLIRTLREALGLTQEELARRAGLRQHTYVSRVEAGGNRLSTRNARRAYAQGFGLDIGQFDAYLDEELSLKAAVAAAKAGSAPGARGELRVERDPAPAMEAPEDASPLVLAVTMALDPARHLVPDGQRVIAVFRDELHQHVNLDADLVEKAAAWLDAAAALRREGRPVTAAALLARVEYGKGPARKPSEASAFQKEIAAIAEAHGVIFGQGAEAAESFRRGKKSSASE